MPFNIFLPKTIAKSSEVNQNFIYLRDKPFVVPNSENTAYTFTLSAPASIVAGTVYENNDVFFTVTTTTSSSTSLVCTPTGIPETSGTLTYVSGTSTGNKTFASVSKTITANHWDLAISDTNLALIGSLEDLDMCDLISVATQESIYVAGVLMVGKITDFANKIITFYKVNDLSTPVSITEASGIQIIYPIHSTFDKMPETVFRTEFVNSFEVSPKWNIEVATVSTGAETVFNLAYTPITNSCTVIRNGRVLLPDTVTPGANDYAISYSAKTITLSEGVGVGSTLMFQYQYISAYY